MIQRTTLIEDLVRNIPDSVGMMMKNGIKCLACGEPVWGTIESTAKEKGLSDPEIDKIVGELQLMQSNQNGRSSRSTAGE
jgi:hypothetical protein